MHGSFQRSKIRSQCTLNRHRQSVSLRCPDSFPTFFEIICRAVFGKTHFYANESLKSRKNEVIGGKAPLIFKIMIYRLRTIVELLKTQLLYRGDFSLKLFIASSPRKTLKKTLKS